MLIASTAITYGVELISKNQKDFRFIEELKLIEYFSR
jgi:predicted nucleic acid-binding protein